MKNYPNVTILDHPLIRHKIAILRDEKTGMKEFRELVEEITTLMVYESFKEVPTKQVMVQTPLELTEQTMVADNAVTVVPILRAGLGMVNGVHTLFPTAKVGHIGLYRDEETLEPHEYYCKLPDAANCPTASRTASQYCSTPCLRRAAPPLRPSDSSRNAVASTSCS